jgi:hypothetical protein
LTLKGRSVSAKVSSIIARAWAAVLAPMPSAPRPPALDTAAASRGVETPAIGAWKIGWRRPRRASRSEALGMAQILSPALQACALQG